MRFWYRIFDANLNRSKEGLRVIEEILRFKEENVKFTQEIREIRHSLNYLINPILKEELLKARKVQSDIGKPPNNLPGGKDSLEKKRINYKSTSDLLIANFNRVEESLRVLEEYSRLINLNNSIKFSRLRFKVYALEKKVFLKLKKQDLKSKLLGLYLITDRELICTGSLFSVVESALKKGVKILQLREKNTPDIKILKNGRKLRRWCSSYNCLFIINDRVDLAQSLDADGVHLGDEDLPINLARKILGEDKIIGKSVSNKREAITAEKEGADYVSLGPIFATSTKPDAGKAVGVTLLKEIKKEVKIPLVAIGGINLQNMEEVLQNGADAVGVVSAIMGAKNPGKVCGDFIKKINEIIKERRNGEDPKRTR